MSAIRGACRSASSQLNSRETAITIKRSRTYTPAVSGLIKIGKKANIAIRVAPSSGIAVFLPMEVSASLRGLPALRSTRMPSTITMALSTSIPIARMKAPRETLCRVPSKKLSTRKEPKTITTSESPRIMPLFSPIKKMSTTTTISTDSSRFSRKVLSESDTLSGWKKTFSYSTPTGNCAESDSSFSSTLLPTLRMS